MQIGRASAGEVEGIRRTGEEHVGRARGADAQSLSVQREPHIAGTAGREPQVVQIQSLLSLDRGGAVSLDPGQIGHGHVVGEMAVPPEGPRGVPTLVRIEPESAARHCSVEPIQRGAPSLHRQARRRALGDDKGARTMYLYNREVGHRPVLDVHRPRPARRGHTDPCSG